MPFRDQIAARAASIYERTAASPEAAHSDPSPDAVAAVRAWIQAFSPGNADAFVRRLSWDDLDLPRVFAALAAPAPCVHATWPSLLEQVIADADNGTAGAIYENDEQLRDVPFVELWAPFVRVAGASVDARIGDIVLASAAPRARLALDHQLIRELARQGELAVHERFRATDRRPGCYRAFISAMRGGELEAFLLEHAVLARQLATITVDWIASSVELLARAHADRAELAKTFSSGADPGIVAAIEPGLSDPHHGRRRVARVEFASGLRVMYKPRSLALDHAVAALLTWFNVRSRVKLPVLRVLECGTHGWVDVAESTPLRSDRDAELYFERAGALACIAYLLRGSDLHFENVIATADGPVLIDVEMLLQPITPASARLHEAIGTEAAAALVSESVLGTGLFTLIDIGDDGAPRDASGLRGEATGVLPFPRRVWKHTGTDEIAFDLEPRYEAANRNRARLGEAFVDVDRHRSSVVSGFERAYQTVIEHRDELTAPGGPLQAFGDTATRVLLRPSNQYAMLLHVLAGPKYQRDGVRASTAIDVLHRTYAGSAERPATWSAVVEERRALAALDVPYFSTPAQGVDVQANGRTVIPGHFERSGFDAVRSRIEGMSPRDLALQSAFVSRALSESLQTRFTMDPPAGDDSARVAIWIARELVARADRAADGWRWRYRGAAHAPSCDAMRLYDGALGPALFLSAVAHIDDAGEFAEAADAARAAIIVDCERALSARSDDGNIGGTSGLGSIVYGLTLLHAFNPKEPLLTLALDAGRAISSRIDTDRFFDIVDGVAGAALALIALHRATGDAQALEDAARCADHLIVHAVSEHDVLAWRSPQGHLLAGFAHGAAGIACALMRVAQATGEMRFSNASERAFEFVDRQFVPSLSNYALAGQTAGTGTEGGSMNAWCHGAPGIIIGALEALDFCANPAILSRAEAALKTIAEPAPAQADHLCCGVMGRVEALTAAGQRLKRQDLIDRGVMLAGDAAARARARGHFRLSGAGVEYRVFDPGFFRGMSGIGYQLLRLAFPSRLPSIASLQPAAAPAS